MIVFIQNDHEKKNNQQRKCITTMHSLLLLCLLYILLLIYCRVSRSDALAIYWSLAAMLAGLTPLNPGWASAYLCIMVHPRSLSEGKAHLRCFIS